MMAMDASLTDRYQGTKRAATFDSSSKRRAALLSQSLTR
jgi:hypothetical protein